MAKTRVKTATKDFLIRCGLYRLDRRVKKALHLSKYRMSYPPYGEETHRLVRGAIDIVRYGAVALALDRIQKEGIPGDLAELGVYKGENTVGDDDVYGIVRYHGSFGSRDHVSQ